MCEQTAKAAYDLMVQHARDLGRTRPGMRSMPSEVATGHRRRKCSATAPRSFWNSSAVSGERAAAHRGRVGAGFGGLRAVQALRRVPVHVVLLTGQLPLFQPMLYQVAD